ncbi:hypothetical protein [Fusobacterium sp. PH5-44]
MLSDFTYSSGEITSVFNERVDFDFSGTKEFYFKNGFIKGRAKYYKGNLDGSFIIYNLVGIPLVIGTYDNGELSGKINCFNDDGSFRNIYFYEKNEKINKIYEYIDGVLSFERDVKEEEINGKSIEYYPNGKIMIVENYAEDMLHGVVQSYYINGQINEDLYYLNDELTGSFKKYYPNGNLMLEGSAIEGYLNGVLRKYNDFGEIEEEIDCDEITKSKVYMLSDISIGGKEILEKEIKQEILDRKQIFSECINEKKNFKSQNKSENISEIAYFYGNGKKKIEFQLVNNELGGKIKIFDKNEKNIVNIEIRKLEKNITAEIYDEKQKLIKVAYFNSELLKPLKKFYEYDKNPIFNVSIIFPQLENTLIKELFEC